MVNQVARKEVPRGVSHTTHSFHRSVAPALHVNPAHFALQVRNLIELISCTFQSST